MKNCFLLLLVGYLLINFTACNNTRQNDNGAIEPEPVIPASELKKDSVHAVIDTGVQNSNTSRKDSPMK